MTHAFRRLIITELPLQAKRKLPAPRTFPVTPNTQQEVIAGRQPIVTDDPAEHPLQRLHQFATSGLRARGRFRLPLHDYLPTKLGRHVALYAFGRILQFRFSFTMGSC